MFDDDPRWGDPRERDENVQDIEVRWIALGRGPSDAPSDGDARERDEDVRDRDRESRHRDHDPRDVFVRDLELPRGREREVVMDGNHRYELNGDDSRTLAATGAFRVVSERDVAASRNDLDRLGDQGLIRTVALDGRDQAVTLTERGGRLLEAHRRDRDDRRQQAFHAGVNRPRELTHDAGLYRAYVHAEHRPREQGASIQRVVLEQELKREYQCFLQERNRGRSDSDGRPDRDPAEIEEWAREHDLPYFDESVHFPDFRIEYELAGRELHEDIEVVTAHYRGAHAASRARAGFTAYGKGGRAGGSPFDPRSAEDYL